MKRKTKRKTIRNNERSSNSYSAKIFLKNSGKSINNRSNSKLIEINKNEEKKDDFNYQITEKDIEEKNKDKEINNINNLNSRTSKSIIILENKKEKDFDNVSHRFENNVINIENDNSYNNSKEINNININIDKRKSIEVYNQNSKDLILRKTKKKNLLSYFKGNNFGDFELNELSYVKAVIYDKRSFFYFYWQLLRREHLIFFTFFSWDDYNILAIKLSKFVFAKL